MPTNRPNRLFTWLALLAFLLPACTQAVPSPSATLTAPAPSATFTPLPTGTPTPTATPPLPAATLTKTKGPSATPGCTNFAKMRYTYTVQHIQACRQPSSSEAPAPPRS